MSNFKYGKYGNTENHRNVLYAAYCLSLTNNVLNDSRLLLPLNVTATKKGQVNYEYFSISANLNYCQQLIMQLVLEENAIYVYLFSII